MIAYLEGQIIKTLDKALIIKVQGVGYLVHATTTICENRSEDEPISLYIYTKVREDDISLYGFETFEERTFFEMLTTVKGVGPKLALEILNYDATKIQRAISSEDIAFLKAIPGIGKKTAERIIIELKNKVTEVAPELSATQQRGHLTNGDAIEALTGLGYQKYEILKVLQDMPSSIETVEDTVTYFLQNV